MPVEKRRLCPVERAESLDNVIRKWLQNPEKILSPFIKPGMAVMDYGCGSGFFTLAMASMVGPSGKVIAVDLQEGMLEKLRSKIDDSGLTDRIKVHRCQHNRIGSVEKVDFVLAFYVIHELPEQGSFFKEIAAILRDDGKLLMVEPPVHVSSAAFSKSIGIAQKSGLIAKPGPRVLLSKTVILEKGMVSE